MRIGFSCLLWRPRPYGVGRSILSLAQALIRTRAGRELVVYLPPGLDLAGSGGHGDEGVRCVRAPRATAWRAGRILWEQGRLPGLGTSDRLDLLQAPGYVLPLRMKVPVVLLVHDLIALEHPELCRRANRWHYALAVPASIRRAAAIVTFSDYVKRSIQERFGAAAPRVTVIPPGVDDGFHEAVDEERLRRVRRSYRLPPRFVLFAGDDEPKKNLARLIQAHRIARERGWVDGELVLTRGRRQGAYPSGVCALGFVPSEDLPALFRLARVLAFPSLVEGFGLPVLEAMASGVPVVCSRVPALEHSGPEAVVLVDPIDVESIANGLAVAWQDEDLRNRLILRGYRITRAASWLNAADALWNFYGEILGARVRGPDAGGIASR